MDKNFVVFQSYRVDFVGLAFVAAGLYLCCLSQAARARYVYEKTHFSGSGSGRYIAILLTISVIIPFFVFLRAHVSDTHATCGALDLALDEFWSHRESAIIDRTTEV